MEYESHVISRTVARDHVYVCLIYRLLQHISTKALWLQRISMNLLLQEFPNPSKWFRMRHFSAPVSLTVETVA